MKTFRPLLWLLVLLPVSCASGPDGGNTAGSAAPPTRKTLSQRLDESNGYKVDSDGNWVPQNNQRSSFESQGDSPYFQGNYQKKQYKTGEYSKKSWWGNKEYGRKEYAGNTDGSRFQKSSRLDGKGAREAGKAADVPQTYQTDTYATNAAREANGKRIAKPANAETENRRGVFPQPEIIDWRQQRSLSLEQSKGILGH